MAQLRKPVFFSAIVDGSIMYDLMTLLDGKSMDLVMRPVKHGGESENGELQPRPSSREFLMAFASSRKQFGTKEAVAEAAPLGISKMAVSGGINTLFTEKVLKRVGVGTYALSGKVAKKIKKHTPGAKHPPGETVTDTILKIVKSKQNGTGEGVALKTIKEELTKRGYQSSGTSPAIAALMNRKQIIRTAPSHYRVGA